MLLLGARRYFYALAISSPVVLGISFGTLCQLMWITFELRSLMYWRLILGISIIFLINVIQLLYMSHFRVGHLYNTFDHSQLR
jgi:hypothetical protein